MVTIELTEQQLNLMVYYISELRDNFLLANKNITFADMEENTNLLINKLKINNIINELDTILGILE